MIGTFTDTPDVLAFVNSEAAQRLAHLGTSCPDHFIRTKIRPLFVDWNPANDASEIEAKADAALATYREEYAAYYKAHALKDSPAMRDANPTVVLVPGVGMFSFGKNKTESRVTGEFYRNAIHVMEGAGGMDEGKCPPVLPQAGPAAPTSAFSVHKNYVALPAERGVPHRVLGAGGGEDPPPAEGAGTEPARCAGRRRGRAALGARRFCWQRREERILL